MAQPHVVVLGAGPAGLGGAYRLRTLDRARVTVLERNASVGGNAGSFEWGGHTLDFGSHRLHPACDPDILADIRRLLGDDLLTRPRHGRIRLRGRWIHFPLLPVDLFLRLDRRFAFGAARDMLLPRRSSSDGPPSFASVLRQSLGPTVCDAFYFPYARKIWGRDPSELSAVQAKKRVSANSFGKLVRKVMKMVPGFGSPMSGKFLYPRGGFGQISSVLADEAMAAGADLRLGSTVVSARAPQGPDDPWQVVTRQNDEESVLHADQVWSTIPLTVLTRIVEGAQAEPPRAAADAMRFRAMLLVYVALDVDRFTPFDAHYLPEEGVRITRLSEPKNYAARSEPAGRTVLCAELPCSTDDPWWTMEPAELGQLVAEDLRRSGIPLPHEPREVLVRRLPQAYPIYLDGYEAHFDALDRWIETLPRFLSYGRQGLFAHDNTHHALAMAYGAADCMGDDGFDHERWAEYRRAFESHVVED
ncbi:MAG: FAD-dependent oxidoreductase [Gemmatimonadetes bacterium]|nr:FAD-dependent oxidoreductase [Gemmatimonadota bacterium]